MREDAPWRKHPQNMTLEELAQEMYKREDSIAFKEWVTSNKLDVGEPWNDRKERHAAMQIAELVVGKVPTTIMRAGARLQSISATIA